MKRLRFVLFFVLLIGICLVTNPVLSDEPQKSEREEMYYKYLGYLSLIEGGTVQAHWMADKNSFWYAEGYPAETVIYKVDPEANTKESLFDTAKIREALTEVLGYEPPYKSLPFNTFTFIDDEKSIKFAVEGKEFICPLDTYKITAVPPLSAEERARTTPRPVHKGFFASAPDVMEVLSTDGCWFLGAEGYNLYIRSTYDGRSEPLTKCGIKDYEWNVSGAKWSPDGLKVTAIKIDTRKVLRIPIMHWLKITEEVEYASYAKAGGPIPQYELYIVDIMSKKAVKVDLGAEPDQFLAVSGWKPDGAELFVGRTDREHKKVDVLGVNPETGESRVILSEVSDTFVYGIDTSPLGKMKFFKDFSKFLWISERDGWAHIYLYDTKGNLIKRLTQGKFPVVDIVAVDEEDGWVYFRAHAEERLYDTHLYRIDLQGQGFQRLTEAIGQHSIQFAPSHEFFLDTHSNIDRPPVVELKKADGTVLQTLSKANIDKLKELKWSPPEEFVVKADDGKTDLYGVMFKPYDFDPNKKYPMLDHIYNGPQTTWVPRSFRNGNILRPIAMAQLDFISVVIDGRGTPHRGKAFQDMVYKNFGQHEIPDHVAAMKQLAKERPYIDLDRVGIFGGSWGGYMTIRAMVLAPNFYRVGVATNPVADHYDHAASAIEPYMGLPQENKEAYEKSSSLKLAHKLKGKLLLICSTNDVNATFSATMKMCEALIRADKPFDLLVMPNQDHHPKGQSQRYWLDAVRRYFQEHLKPE
ncbi:MAG TPA: DPP IV N-terminal domain-containing protein [Candidatus Heimdallarchaeota archaeon]|nr:DPP IV N-terminal domain-containing protein [Candidatus Heimdallarchaeota archaeon]